VTWALMMGAVAAAGISLPAGMAVALKADGRSFETAVVIEASTEAEGVRAEYAYVRRAYPGWTSAQQALLHHGQRNYDMLTLVSPSGETKQIYFDITSFFGRR
jgi:hypothetical protein